VRLDIDVTDNLMLGGLATARCAVQIRDDTQQVCELALKLDALTAVVYLIFADRADRMVLKPCILL